MRRGIVSGALCVVLLLMAGAADAKNSDPAELCKNQLLTYRQRYQCEEEMENIETKADLTRIQRKFSELIRAAEKAKEDGK